MMEALFIMLAGSLGALTRWGVGKFTKNALPENFAYASGSTNPIGTLIVNVVGCFLLGLAMESLFARDHIPKTYKAAITTGFLGSFTTFSTFGYETFTFLRNEQWLAAATNATANLLLGLLAVWLGIWVGKTIAP